MAKSKSAKSRRKQRKANAQPQFYEAMPAMTIAPVALPQVSDQLGAGWRAAVTRIKPFGPRLAQYLHATWTDLAELIAQRSRNASVAARFAGEATFAYGPSIVTDVAGFTGRTGRRLVGRQARAIYLMIAAGAAMAAVITIGITSTATLKAYANDISSPAALMAKKKTGTTILDRNGQVLFQGYGAQPTSLVSINDIPDSLKLATLASEDPDFYDHPGVSWRGTLRAAVTDITHQSRAEGGSTLTQQLVKNALLTNDKKFERKYKEILLATQLEQQYSKDQILEMYLNETYYGQGSSGVEAASQTYYHKPASQLTLAESALLAGLPLGPSRLDPNVSLDAATGRRDYVLARMAELGKITQAEAAAAKAQPIALAGTPEAEQPGAMVVYAKTIVIRAPHFVFYVLDQLRSTYGEEMIENGGITVKTTLDITKQDLAQQTVTTQINKLAEHHVTNGGLVSLDPKTGDILAMVGSTDYNAPGFGNVNVTLSDLQPGSSFKPIAYATAFKKGWTGATIIQDTPFSAPSGDGTMYTPMNYDLKFHGNVTVRKALDNSLNIPAVKTLQFAGIPDTIQTAHDLGITTLSNPSSYGLALVLGGGEVRPIDMATVYATFANNGTKVEPRSILRVDDRYGKDITKSHQAAPQNVLDPRVAYMITNILSDDTSRQPEFPANGPLTLPGRPAAAKTGTTNDFRDNWTVGYTPQLVTAVWVGNNDHSAMNNVDGITGAAPIWHEYMTGALADQPIVNFPVPAGITVAKVCYADGGLANPWDSGYAEVFKADSMPTKPCASSAPKPTPTPDPAATSIPVTTEIITIPSIPEVKIPRGRNPFAN